LKKLDQNNSVEKKVLGKLKKNQPTNLEKVAKIILEN